MKFQSSIFKNDLCAVEILDDFSAVFIDYIDGLDDCWTVIISAQGRTSLVWNGLVQTKLNHMQEKFLHEMLDSYYRVLA